MSVQAATEASLIVLYNTNFNQTMNPLNMSDHAVDFSILSYVKQTITILYGILCVGGILGNVCVICMTAHVLCDQRWRNFNKPPSNALMQANLSAGMYVYILALSVVDLLVLATLPMVIVKMHFNQWPFGIFLCKFQYTVESVNKLLSTFLLTVLSFERYLAVCHAHRSYVLRNTSRPALMVFASLSLAVALLLVVPISADVNQYAIQHANISVPECQLNEGRWFVYYTFVTGFVIPGALIVFFYGSVMYKLYSMSSAVARWSAQNNQAPRFRQVTTRALTVIVFYFACWTPYWLVMLFGESLMGLIPNDSTELMYWVFCAQYFVHLLVYFNSAANPILYALLNRQLRQEHRLVMQRRTATVHEYTRNLSIAAHSAADYLGRHSRRSFEIVACVSTTHVTHPVHALRNRCQSVINSIDTTSPEHADASPTSYGARSKSLSGVLYDSSPQKETTRVTVTSPVTKAGAKPAYSNGARVRVMRHIYDDSNDSDGSGGIELKQQSSARLLAPPPADIHHRNQNSSSNSSSWLSVTSVV